MKQSAKTLGSVVTEISARKLREIIGVKGVNNHLCLDALDWLLYQAAKMAPAYPELLVIQPPKPKMRDKEAQRLEDEHAEHSRQENLLRLAPYNIIINDLIDKVGEVVLHASTVFPATRMVFNTVERFTKEVIKSTRTKDPRIAEHCHLCNNRLRSTDARRTTIRYVPLHDFCPGVQITKVKQFLGLIPLARPYTLQDPAAIIPTVVSPTIGLAGQKASRADSEIRLLDQMFAR